MVAYCYGGVPALIIAKKPDVIDTFVVAHAQVKVPADITTNVKPGLIIAAEIDYAFPEQARKQAQEIIEKENLVDQIRIRYFPGTFHGFAVRGDDRVEVIRKAKEDAFRVAVEWLKEHLI
jgi:dienelactone hydrolase